ncbi:MAG: thioredoxin [Planctomycetota bacterium]|jgi:thioredoxin 1|nr:thioredoxin [Blastopirellula sp.]
MKKLIGLCSVLLMVGLVGCEAAKTPDKAASPEKGGKQAAANGPATTAGAGNQVTAAAGESETHFAKVISEASFETDVLKSDQVVLVDCWAPWCGPCRQIAPVIEEIAKDFEGQAVIAKLDVDTAPGISQKYEINAIPALLIFKNGEVVDKIVGLQPKEQIVAKLKSVMGQ